MKIMNVGLLVVLASLILACEKSPSIGSVDGEAVTKAEYEAYLKLKNIPINDSERYERFKDEYLKREALAEAIEKSGRLDNHMIEAEINEFKKQILINRYFETYLKDQGSEEALQNYYAANIEKYQSEQVHVAHILFRVRPGMSEPERQAILTSAHEAYSKIEAGEDFAEVAKALSEDKVSGAKGGDLGWLVKGAVAPEFSDKAFAMEKGAVSEPFLTSFGFHIIKVLDDAQVVKKSMDAVKGDIRYQLRSNAKQAETKRLMGTVTYDVKESN